MLLKRKKTEGEVRKSKIGRVFSGLFSLVYGSVFVIGLLFVVNNNLTGVKILFDQTNVTKKVLDKVEHGVNELGKKILKEEKLKDKIVLKIYKGDLMYKVSDDFVESFNYADKEFDEIINNKKYLEVLENPSLQNEEARVIIKKVIRDLDNLAVIAKEFNENPLVKNNFSKMYENFTTTIQRKITNDKIGKIELSISEFAKVRKDLVDVGISEEMIKKFEAIAEAK